MNHLRLFLLTLALNAATSVSAQQAAPAPQPSQEARDAPTSVFADSAFPSATYACTQIAVPVNDADASRTIDEARAKWLDLAQKGGLRKASATLLHARVAAGAGIDPTAPLSAQLCAIVDKGTTVAGMTIVDIAARRGAAGFCANQLQVEPCLAAAAEAAGYGPNKPWTWLPVYARWPTNLASPKTASEIIAQLSAMPIEIKAVPSGQGEGRAFGTGQRLPLVVCEGNCGSASSPVTLAPTGPGVGWFIPADPPAANPGN